MDANFSLSKRVDTVTQKLTLQGYEQTKFNLNLVYSCIRGRTVSVFPVNKCSRSCVCVTKWFSTIGVNPQNQQLMFNLYIYSIYTLEIWRPGLVLSSRHPQHIGGFKLPEGNLCYGVTSPFGAGGNLAHTLLPRRKWTWEHQNCFVSQTTAKWSSEDLLQRAQTTPLL